MDADEARALASAALRRNRLIQQQRQQQREKLAAKKYHASSSSNAILSTNPSLNKSVTTPQSHENGVPTLNIEDLQRKARSQLHSSRHQPSAAPESSADVKQSPSLPVRDNVSANVVKSRPSAITNDESKLFVSSKTSEISSNVKVEGLTSNAPVRTDAELELIAAEMEFRNFARTEAIKKGLTSQMEIEKFIQDQLFMLFGSNFKSSIVSKPVSNSDQTLQQPGKVGGVVGISPFVMSDIDGLSTIHSVDEESQSVTNSVSDFSSTIRGSPTSSFHGISTRRFNEETECQYERNQSSPQSDEAEDDEALKTVTTSTQSIENSSTNDHVQVNGLKPGISSERQNIDDVVVDEVHTELQSSSYIDVNSSSSNYEVSEILDKDKEKKFSAKKMTDHNLPDNSRNAEVNQTLSMKVPQFSEEVCHTDKIHTGSQSEGSKSENVNKESNTVSVEGKKRMECLTVEMVSMQSVPGDLGTCEANQAKLIEDEVTDERYVAVTLDRCELHESETGESNNMESTNGQYNDDHLLVTKKSDKCIPDESGNATSVQAKSIDERLITITVPNKCISDDSDADQANAMLSVKGDDIDEHFSINSDQRMPDDSETVESCNKITIDDRSSDECLLVTNISDENVPEELDTGESSNKVSIEEDDSGNSFAIKVPDHFLADKSDASTSSEGEGGDESLHVTKKTHQLSDDSELNKLTDTESMNEDNSLDVNIVAKRRPINESDVHNFDSENKFISDTVKAVSETSVHNNFSQVVDRGESDETFTKQAPQVSPGESEETRDQSQSSWKSGDAKHTSKTEMLEPLMQIEVSPNLKDVPKVTCSVKIESDLFNNDTMEDDVDTNNVHQDGENQLKKKEHGTIRVGTSSDKDDVVDEIEKSSDEVDGSLGDQCERKPTKSDTKHTRKDEAFESLIQVKAPPTATGEFGDVSKVMCSVKIESDLLIDDASTAGSDNIIDPDNESESNREKYDIIHASTSLDQYDMIDKTEKAVNEPDGSLEVQDERKRSSLQSEEAKYTVIGEIFESLTQIEESHTAMVGFENGTKVTSSVKIESDNLVNDTLKDECSDNIMDPDIESQRNQEERDTKYVSTNPDQYDEIKVSADEAEGSLEDQSNRSQNSLESEESRPIPRDELNEPSMQVVDSHTAFDEFRDIPKVSSSIKNKSDFVIDETSKGGNDNTFDIYGKSQEEHDTGHVSTNPGQDDVVDMTEKSTEESLEDEEDNSVVTFGSVEKKNVPDNESVNKRDIDRTPKRRNKGDLYVPADRNVDVDEEHSALDEDLGGSIRSLNSSGSYTDDETDDAEIHDNAKVVFWWNDDHAVTSMDNSLNASKSVEEKSMNTDQSSLSAGMSTPALVSSVTRLSSLRLMRKKYSDDRRVNFRHQSKGRRIMLSVESLQPSAKFTSVAMDNEIVEWRVPPAHVKELINSLHAVSMSRRSHACGALKVMSTKKANLFSLARTEGLLDSIIFAIESTFNAVTEMDVLMDIRSRAMAVLSNIASLPRNRALLYNRPGLTSCLTTILREDYLESRVLACVIFAYLSKNDEFKESIIQIDGLVDMLTDLFSGKHHGPFFNTKDESGSLSGSSCSAKSVLNYVKEDSKAGIWEGVDERSQLRQTSSRDNDDKSFDSGISKLTMTSGVPSETQCENISPLQLKLYEKKSKPYLSQTQTNVCAIFLQLSRFSITSKKIGLNTKFTSVLMRNCQESSLSIHSKCIEILCQLTFHPSFTTQLFDRKEFMDILTSAVTTNIPACRIWGLRIALNISCSAVGRKALINSPLSSCLPEYATLDSSNDEQTTALSIICNLASDEDTALKIFSIPGAVASLSILSTSDSRSIRDDACSALDFISFWCQEYAIQSTVPPDFNFEENYLPTKSVYKINGHDGKS